MLKNIGRKAVKQSKWCKQWFTLRGNKIYYYAKSTDINSISFIPLYEGHTMVSLEPVEHSPGFSQEEIKRVAGCFLRISTPQRHYFLIGESAQVAKRWAELLNDWLPFFQDDGTRAIKAESVYEKGLLDSSEIPAERLVYNNQDFTEPVAFLAEASERRRKMKNNKDTTAIKFSIGDDKPKQEKGSIEISLADIKKVGEDQEKEKEQDNGKGKEKEQEWEKEKEKEQEKETEFEYERGKLRRFTEGRDGRRGSIRGQTGVIGLKNNLSEQERQKLLQELQREGSL